MDFATPHQYHQDMDEASQVIGGTNTQAVPATAAEALEGQELDGGWIVRERHPRRALATGGMFSICYRVENVDGRLGFLKALDYSSAFNADDPTKVLETLLAAFNYEREVVRQCAERRMTHVIMGIDSGDIRLDGFGVIVNQASYLIFEEARSDSRAHLDMMDSFDDAWVLRALHNVAVGLGQLHRAGIAHQDLKPSNVLVFSAISKIGDLGRSASDGRNGPCDANSTWGDPNHAPPERLYLAPMTDMSLSRLSTDIYHLGSLILFFFTRVGTTAALTSFLDPSFRPDRRHGNYEEVLPHLRSAFDQVAESLRAAIPTKYSHELVDIFRQLCDPDPRLRGNSKAQKLTKQRYAVERYIAILDRLARAAEISLRRTLS